MAACLAVEVFFPLGQRKRKGGIAMASFHSATGHLGFNWGRFAPKKRGKKGGTKKSGAKKAGGGGRGNAWRAYVAGK
jgi:hypothetical protein